MTPRLWLVPLATILLAGALSPAGAVSSRDFMLVKRPPPETDEPRQSHGPVDNGLEDLLRPEDRLAERRRWARQRKGQEDEQLKQEIQQLAKALLKDRGLIESLRKSLSPQDLRRLREKLENRDNLDND